MYTDNWRWFVLKDIFDVMAGKYHYKEEYEEGETPYLSATAENNGVVERINIPAEFNGGVITTEKVKCTAFYQASPFCATSDVNIIRRKGGIIINPYVGLFLSTIIDFNESFRWTYGRQCRVNDTQNIRIKLPTTISGEPDWKYMEKYIKETIIPKLPQKARDVWRNNYNTNPLLENKILLTAKDWKWFKVDSFCEKPYKAKAYNANELIECKNSDNRALLYVTRTDVNNGSKCFVINENFDKIEKANAITIGDTTSTVYYQEREFICGDHMVILRSKHFNRYTGLFISTLLNKERYRYNYGRAFSMDNISKTMLKLPVTTTGTPNWQFMEDYIKSLPYSKNI